MHKFNFCRISFNLAINTEQLLENNLKEEQTAKKYFQYFIFSQFEEWGNYYSVTDNSRRSSNSSGSRVEKKWKSFRHLHKILQANNMRKKTSSSALLCAICSLSSSSYRRRKKFLSFLSLFLLRTNKRVATRVIVTTMLMFAIHSKFIQFSHSWFYFPIVFLSLPDTW